MRNLTSLTLCGDVHQSRCRTFQTIPRSLAIISAVAEVQLECSWDMGQLIINVSFSRSCPVRIYWCEKFDKTLRWTSRVNRSPSEIISQTFLTIPSFHDKIHPSAFCLSQNWRQAWVRYMKPRLTCFGGKRSHCEWTVPTVTPFKVHDMQLSQIQFTGHSQYLIEGPAHIDGCTSA